MNPSMAEPLAVNLTVNLNTEAPHIMVPPSAPPEMETGNGGCIYCLTKVVHPRLGRGESYACGYKPYRCEICNYSTVTKGNLAIHEQSDRHLNNVQEYDQQQKLQCVHKSVGQDTINPSINTIPAPVNQSPLPATNFFPQTYFAFLEAFSQKDGTCQLNDFSPDFLEVANHTLFCQICGIFGTDSVEELINHAEQSRIPTNLDLANQQLTTHTSGVWHCNLCAYRSPLKANFQLHCKTEKHAQRLSLLLHMWEGKEGGLGAILPANNLLLSPSPKSSLYCQLRCLPCGFFTCSVHKMRVHCQTPVHGFLAGIFCVVDPFGRYPSEPEDVTVLWEFNREGGMRNHFATTTETSQLFQVANVIGPDTCPKEAEGDSNARTSSPVLVPNRWGNEVSLGGRSPFLKKCVNVDKCYVCKD
ncbi:Zinc finger protein 2 [Taenia solium]|eukprot:TsM_000452600 transcript=TsM_000452600 gene=TsM_000452600